MKRLLSQLKNKDLSFYVFNISFILIICGIIYYKPSFFLFIPLLISAFVMFLQSKVSRFAFAAGSVNALLYATAYIKMGLYASAVYAISVSFPLQVLTFLNWSRHTQKNITELKHIPNKIRIMLLISAAVIWGILYVAFCHFNSQYLLLDNSVAILGIICTVLCALRYREYVFLQIISNIIGVMMYAIMFKNDHSKIIWLISSANATVCSCIAFKNIK